MKSVLISIQPKWCELIASGKKTVEIRKTRPKLETPFKVYIYCTKSRKPYESFAVSGNPYECGGKVIGEFVCDEIYKIDKDSVDFIYKTETEHTYFEFAKGVYGFDTCLTEKELLDYLNYKQGYGWHISNLVIYEKPKGLSEFYTLDNEAVQKCEHREQTYYGFTDTGYIKNGMYCKYKDDWCTKCKRKTLKRPPQSWCYVEERGESDA